MTVGERIKKLRLGANLTQMDVANAIGTTKQAIYKYENNIVTNIPTDKIEAMARLFNVTPARLAGWPDSSDNQTCRKGVRIPVLGQVPAGVPIEAITEFDAEDPDDWEEITEEMAASGTFFALRIKGDSMTPTICDGDIVIVRQQEDVNSGEIAVVMVNGDDATCKRVVKQTQGISLVANNPAYEPRFFTNKEIIETPVRVIGKVIELRRSF